MCSFIAKIPAIIPAIIATTLHPPVVHHLPAGKSFGQAQLVKIDIFSLVTMDAFICFRKMNQIAILLIKKFACLHLKLPFLQPPTRNVTHTMPQRLMLTESYGPFTLAMMAACRRATASPTSPLATLTITFQLMSTASKILSSPATVLTTTGGSAPTAVSTTMT